MCFFCWWDGRCEMMRRYLCIVDTRAYIRIYLDVHMISALSTLCFPLLNLRSDLNTWFRFWCTGRGNNKQQKIERWCTKMITKYIFFQFVKVFDSGYFTTSLAWKSQVKAYTTRVGHGPFPTELQNETQSLEVRYGNFWDYRNAYYS